MQTLKEHVLRKARNTHKHGTYRGGKPLLHPHRWTPWELNDLKLATLSSNWIATKGARNA